MTYIMESGAETQRLIAQQRADNVRQALALTGLRPGAHVLDAGCGPGVITGELAEVVGPSGRVTGLELSPERLEEARRLNAHRPEVSFVQADIRRTGLPDASFDYSWSQFVLEYLPDRRVAIEELMRVTRPGGKVVVSEIDGLGFNNWPFPESL
ncbi:MAG TPA: methyltransferase domain-containing protein, partial [Myxococcaceae bacterium]|nr:methyltransferase domain-containing protein [Myxococcaceae bacterium]